MIGLPASLWAVSFAGILGVAATTCIVLFRGAVSARLGMTTAVLLTVAAAVVIGGWYVASAAIAAHGGYRAQLGRQVPWMPIVAVGFTVLLLALSRIRVVERAFSAPGTSGGMLLPHSFRAVEGAVFIAAMLIGRLPALFAIPAGLGDIAVGIAAPFVARKLARGTGSRAALGFNVLGIADLVTALVLGALTGFHLIAVAPSAQAISDLPLALVPTAAVPLLLVLHILSLSTRVPEPAIAAKTSETARGSSDHASATSSR